MTTPATFQLTLDLARACGADLPARAKPWSIILDNDWAVAFNPTRTTQLVAPPTMTPILLRPLHSAAWFKGYPFGTAHQRGSAYFPHTAATPQDLADALADALAFLKENTP